MGRNVYIDTYEMSFEDYTLWIDGKGYYDFYHELFISQEKYEEHIKDIMLYENYSEADAKRVVLKEEITMSFDEFQEYICNNEETPGNYGFVTGSDNSVVLVIAGCY
jgi:hypothetical protein